MNAVRSEIWWRYWERLVPRHARGGAALACARQGKCSKAERSSPSSTWCGAGARIARPSSVFACRNVLALSFSAGRRRRRAEMSLQRQETRVDLFLHRDEDTHTPSRVPKKTAWRFAAAFCSAGVLGAESPDGGFNRKRTMRWTLDPA